MNRKRDLDWSEIEITGDDTEIKDLELNLDEDLNSDGNQKAEDTRRANFTVSKDNNQNQENKNPQARTKIEEDQEEREVPRKQTREAEVTQEEDDETRPAGRAQRRIQNLTRAKRELAEQVQRLAEENQALKMRTRETEKRSAIAMRENFKKALDDTETQLEAAQASNDTAKVAKLTRQIADLTMRHNAYAAVADDFENEVEEKPINQQQVAPEIPEETVSWIKRNPWFFKDEVRHVAARSISRELSEEGMDPNDRTYWDELDLRLKKKFNEIGSETKQIESKEPTRRKGPVSSSRHEEDVGSYDFNNDTQFKRNGNRVQANPTKSDYEMAEKLGISIEDQMREKFKYAKQGYSGYVKIDIPGQ